MTVSKLSLAQALSQAPRRESSDGHKSVTHTVVGTACSDSSEGQVDIDLGGDVVSDDGVQAVPVATSADVREGDQVLVSLIGADGSAKEPVVTGVISGGDRTKREIDESRSEVESLDSQLSESSAVLDDLSGRVTANETTISGVSDQLADEIETREAYWRLDEQEGLIVGRQGSTSHTVIDDDGISFVVDGEEAASTRSDGLHTPRAVIDDALFLGGFALIPRSSGGVAFKWIGET